MDKTEWQKMAISVKELLALDTLPVAVSCLDQKEFTTHAEEGKARICRAILDAAAGKEIQICRNNNACFGAAWHLGFQKIHDPQVLKMTKEFVVEGEKLFSSHEALEHLISQMDEVGDNSKNCFYLAPLENTRYTPQLIIFVVNPEQACRLLTLVTFHDGRMPQIKIGGPTCRMAIMYPLLKSEVNLSFYDYTARKICHVDADKLLISIPASKLPDIIHGIDKCSAGTAKIEYPQEFREFLQRRTKVSGQ